MRQDRVHRTKTCYFVRGLLVFGLFIAGKGLVLACPIPVFQYALENWATDPYEITIFHQDELSESHQATLSLLKDAQNGDTLPANVQLTIHNVSENDDIESPVAAASLPYMQVRFPIHSRLPDPVWSGSLSSENVHALLNSPMREKLGQLLLDRKTAVWILLEGKKRSDNDAAFTLLQDELSRLEQTLVLPSSAEWEDQTVQIYDKISFEVIRLDRNAPDEQMLVRMLLASEADLLEFGDVPMAFPIYGRGLILYALVNKGINPWTVSEAGNFLAGPCSCQIKAGNPGLDVLMSVDWDANIEPLAAQRPPAPVGTGGFIRRLEEAEDELDDDD